MKGKISQAIDFIEYISKPMKKEDMLVLYKIQSITPERTELYFDFVCSLFDLVTTTYLGDEVMDGDATEKHFNWCWDKNLKNFQKEGIYFHDKGEIYDYFSSLFLESFYCEEDKSEDNVNKLLQFWEIIFSYGELKTRSELETFFDLYKLFEKSIYV